MNGIHSNDEWVVALGELLAVIHRDGGQYVAEHELYKALIDAVEVVNADRLKLSMSQSSEHERDRLRDITDEYDRLIRHMDAGGDFYAFQMAESSRRNGHTPGKEDK